MDTQIMLFKHTVHDLYLTITVKQKKLTTEQNLTIICTTGSTPQTKLTKMTIKYDLVPSSLCDTLKKNF